MLTLCTTLVLALALPVPCLPVPPQGELERAKELFEQSEESACNEATQICVRANDVPAVELMLDVLRQWHDRGGRALPQAHYRDVVWGGICRITDPYARKRVETEMRTNKDSAWVRQWCAEALGEYADASFGDGLVKQLKDKELGVQRAAARALGKLRYEPAQKALLGEVGDKDFILRTNAIEALARIDVGVHEALLMKGLKDKDAGVRCALLATASETLKERAEAPSIAALEDADWRPRLQAVDNLGTIRTKSAVDGLLKALADGRPTVVTRAVRRLQELTGQKHTRREVWEAWWRDQRDSFTFPEGLATAEAGGSQTVAYHGVQLSSDHVAFLIDRSDEMKETLKSKSTSKQEAALAELEGVLSKLEGRLVFNVFCYAEKVEVLDEKKPVELTSKTRKRALDFVRDARQGNAKDIWALLEQVIQDPDLDTAFLLSSGEPDIGTYVHWNRVTWQLADLNRFHKVVVHTIAYSDNDWYRSQLEKIAQVTGGEFRWFE